MLASTVQFSKYGQHPPETPAHPTTHKQEAQPYKADKRQTTSDPASTEPDRKNKPNPHQGADVCSLRTQQCAYAPSPQTNPVPPNPKTGVLEAEADQETN
jgi:hypothetical protein